MSIEKTLQSLTEQAEELELAGIDLTEEDLQALSEEELELLVNNAGELNELSQATLATYVGKTAAMGSEEGAAAATAKVKAKLANGDKASMLKPPASTEAGKDTVITDASSREAGEKTKTRTEEIDLGGLLDGDELSEEFKTKAKTVFEAAVAARVAQMEEAIREELAQKNLTESAEFKTGLNEKVAGYLGYVSEKWMEKNELALDRGIKSEMFESLIGDLKGLFESHNFNVPEDKFDALEEAKKTNDELAEQINSLTEDNVAMSMTIKLHAKQSQIEEACDGLSEVEAEKFARLAEAIVFENAESFGSKLTAIKETYFKATPAKKNLQESFITDEPVQLVEEQTQGQIDPVMNRYVKALNK